MTGLFPLVPLVLGWIVWEIAQRLPYGGHMPVPSQDEMRRLS